MKREDVEKFKLWKPCFESDVVDSIFRLEHLRAFEVQGTTPEVIFSQLRDILHSAESLMSLRLEGNKTEIIEYAQAKLDSDYKKEPIKEVSNYETALNHTIHHIESGGDIDDELICTLHEIVVDGLSPHPIGDGDGDIEAGNYGTKKGKRIGNEETGVYHYPPEYTVNVFYMARLFEFLTEEHSAKYDVIKIGQTHQHFAWIHPFNNGNGRVGRLLTYAMLLKSGFSVRGVITPSSIFCGDRDEYNQKLAACDSGDSDDAKMAWLEYVNLGIIREIDKIRKLLDYDFIKKNILYTAIEGAFSHNQLTAPQFEILTCIYHLEHFKSADLSALKNTRQHRSRLVKEMLDNKILSNFTERSYRINYLHPQLMYGVLKAFNYNEILPNMESGLVEVLKGEGG